MTYTVAVDYTDRSRDTTGAFTLRHTTVTVLAGAPDVAVCTAAQIVAATRPESYMVTTARVVQ